MHNVCMIVTVCACMHVLCSPFRYSSGTISVNNLKRYWFVICVESRQTILEAKLFKSVAWNSVISTKRKDSCASAGCCRLVTPWVLYNKTGEGDSCLSSVTIRSTDIASSVCRWFVKSRNLRHMFLLTNDTLVKLHINAYFEHHQYISYLQSCRVTKCFLVATSRNLWRCCRLPKQALMSARIVMYIVNV